MSDITYLSDNTVSTFNNNSTYMCSALRDSDCIVSHNKLFEISDRIVLSREYDGYYNFQNVKEIKTICSGTKNIFVFDTEVLLTCVSIYEDIFIYPIDPSQPMYADVVIMNMKYREDLISGKTLNKGVVVYSGGVIANFGVNSNVEIVKLY